MPDRKCTACGSEELKPIPILYGSICEGKVEQTVDSFYCTQCGHIELYARSTEIQKCVEKEKLQKAAEEETKAREAEIKRLELRKAELKAIISDENQTVKAVREAETELKNVEMTLRRLIDSGRVSKFKH